jgi:nitronate monooxygenase
VKVIHKCTAVRHAVSAEKMGVDAISIDGFECAGHPGEDDVPGLILIPAAAERVIDPDDRLGRLRRRPAVWLRRWRWAPTGINMGTRFLRHEGGADPRQRQAGAGGQRRAGHRPDLPHDAQHLAGRPQWRSAARRSRWKLRARSSRRCGNWLAGAGGRKVYETGDLDAGVWSAGMVQALIHDIPSVRELVDRIVSEAEGLIASRLAGMRA